MKMIENVRRTDTKTCIKCKSVKTIDQYRFRKDKNLYINECKTCEKLAYKKWAIENKEHLAKKDFRRNLRKKFNMSEAEYFTKYEQQNNGCAICKKPKSTSGRFLAVDHNHKTLEIRGLLCNECNTALGLLNENPDLMQNMIDYIKKYQKQRIKSHYDNIIDGNPQGRSHTFANAQNQQTASSLVSFFVYVIQDYQLVTITNLLMEQTKTSAGRMCRFLQ